MSNAQQLDLIADRMVNSLTLPEAYHLVITAARIARRYLQEVADSGECLDMMREEATLSIPSALRCINEIIAHGEAYDMFAEGTHG